MNFPNHLVEMDNVRMSVDPYQWSEEEWENYCVYRMKYYYR